MSEAGVLVCRVPQIVFADLVKAEFFLRVGRSPTLAVCALTEQPPTNLVLLHSKEAVPLLGRTRALFGGATHKCKHQGTPKSGPLGLHERVYSGNGRPGIGGGRSVVFFLGSKP